MKKEEIEKEKLEKVDNQLDTVLEEIRLLSKKSPNDPLNKFKLKYVNLILTEANNFLEGKHKPFEDFTVFNDEDMPSNSDVVFILSQYKESLEKLFKEIKRLEHEAAVKKRQQEIQDSLKG
jgi:hypothetical protein